MADDSLDAFEEDVFQFGMGNIRGFDCFVFLSTIFYLFIFEFENVLQF